MSSRDHSKWGWAAILGGIGALGYIVYREVNDISIDVPSMIPDVIGPKKAPNPSRSDPEHWAYQLRKVGDNPNYDMTNYSRDVYAAGEAIEQKFTPSFHGELCEIFGPFNDLESPFGKRSGYVVMFQNILTKEEYEAKTGPILLGPDSPGYISFVERTFAPVWLPNPDDSRFGPNAPLISPLNESHGADDLDPPRVAYQRGAWVGWEYAASSDLDTFVCGGLNQDVPSLVETLRTYDRLKDARDDL